MDDKSEALNILTKSLRRYNDNRSTDVEVEEWKRKLNREHGAACKNYENHVRTDVLHFSAAMGMELKSG